MSHRMSLLETLNNELKKNAIKEQQNLKDKINESIKWLLMKKLVTEKDAILMQDPKWKQAAFDNWIKEPQFSSRCPDCQIDIIGPRKLMHMHLKKHQAKKEFRENEHFNQNFRIHYARPKDFL